MKHTMRYVITGGAAGLGIAAILCGVMMLTGIAPVRGQMPQEVPVVTAAEHEEQETPPETEEEADAQSTPDDDAVPVNIVSEDAPVPEKLQTKTVEVETEKGTAKITMSVTVEKGGEK